jgi:hypothetical protein
MGCADMLDAMGFSADGRARACTPLAVVVLLLATFVPSQRAEANPPFVVTASAGPAAGSHIIATVTRTVDNASVTLPAALVPALAPGDVVDLDFPDYRRPPGTVNYHVNVAFITETAPRIWLFPQSGPRDRLFTNEKAMRKRGPAMHTGTIHFVYGTGGDRGIPIFFIIPEDAKTRGVDGVRDYVDAHPTDFVDMSQGTNAAVDRYGYLSDFLTSLAQGSIDPANSQYRIESIAQGLGVSPATIDACYVAGEPPAAIDNCVQQAVNATIYQTDFSAPTQAQFLGGVIGAASPLTYAPYIESLLAVWHLFVHTGHQEYEYLPTTISLADPSTARHDELLMGLKVPTIRPPAAFSDVLFFTIGDPQATEHAPVVVNDAPAGGLCERNDRFTLPLHLDHTSRYVHDTALVVTPDDGSSSRITIDPRALTAPVLDRSRLGPSPDGAYTVSLRGAFGFDAIDEPAERGVRLAVPTNVAWSIRAAPHQDPVAGTSLDLIATSASAPCLSHAEMQMGNAAPIALTATHLDAQRVELHASLAGVPPGPARVYFDEDDLSAVKQRESSVPVAIVAPPARIDPTPAVAALGDDVLDLRGHDLDGVRGVRIGAATYVKTAGSNATTACFAGPPIGRGLTVGASTPAEFVNDDGTLGAVFPLTIGAARPLLAPVRIDGVLPDSGPMLSTTLVPLTLASASGAFPRQLAIRIRHADPTSASPCDAVRDDPTAVTLPATSVVVRDPTTISVRLNANVLHDRAFGTVQLQVVDTANATASAWVAIPGTFVRAPEVAQIACPAAPTTSCRLYGTDLETIDALESAPGTFVALTATCPPSDKGLACLVVPRLPHYVFRLVDAGTLESIPDTTIN